MSSKAIPKGEEKKQAIEIVKIRMIIIAKIDSN